MKRSRPVRVVYGPCALSGWHIALTNGDVEFGGHAAVKGHEGE